MSDYKIFDIDFSSLYPNTPVLTDEIIREINKIKLKKKRIKKINKINEKKS